MFASLASLMVATILGGGGAFIRKECLIQTLYLKGGAYYIGGVCLSMGVF